MNDLTTVPLNNKRSWGYIVIIITLMINTAILIPTVQSDLIPSYTVEGIVTNSNGVIQGASVVVRNWETNEFLTTTTDSNGYYSVDLVNLPSGYSNDDRLLVVVTDVLGWGQVTSNYGDVDISMNSLTVDVTHEKNHHHIAEARVKECTAYVWAEDTISQGNDASEDAVVFLRYDTTDERTEYEGRDTQGWTNWNLFSLFVEDKYPLDETFSDSVIQYVLLPGRSDPELKVNIPNPNPMGGLATREMVFGFSIYHILYDDENKIVNSWYAEEVNYNLTIHWVMTM